MQLQSTLFVGKIIKTVIRLFFAPSIVLILFLLLERVVKIRLMWPSADIPLHLIGGVAIAYSLWIFLPILQARGVLKFILPWMKILFVVIGVALAAVSWEIIERYPFSKVSFQQIDYSDTVKDITVGIFGGFIGGIYFVFRGSRVD